MTPEQLGGSRSPTPERTRAGGYPTVPQARARVLQRGKRQLTWPLAAESGSSLQLTPNLNEWLFIFLGGRRHAELQ